MIEAVKSKLFAVGLDMMISAIIILVTRSETSSTIGILLMMLVLWVVSTVVRKYGWESENQLKLNWGVIFPDLAGFLCIVAVCG